MEQEGKREQVSRMLAGSSFGEKALVQSPKRFSLQENNQTIVHQTIQLNNYPSFQYLPFLKPSYPDRWLSLHVTQIIPLHIFSVH